MILSYLRLALRSLLRYKVYAFINIFGLAIGMACCGLILLFIQDEVSFDKFHENAGQIYRVLIEKSATGQMSATMPPPLAPALHSEFPAIVRAVRFFNPDNPVPLVRHGGRRFYEKSFFFTDSTVFDIFSFTLLEGDPRTALKEPFSVVITGEMAQKYFGDENPIGKTVSFERQLDFTVTGVLKNVPHTSHLKFDFLASFATLERWLGTPLMSNWRNHMCLTYVLLRKGYSSEVLETQFPAFVKEHFDEASSGKLHLQPLPRIHLHSKTDYRIASGGDIQQIYTLSTIALSILLIACINYMNLSTARSAHRAREVGMRKVMGASRSQLVRQFLGESILLSVVALLLAVALIEAALPSFDALTGKQLGAGQMDAAVLVGLGGIALLAGIVAGSYPALFLSAFRPAEALKGGWTAGSSRPWFRRGLVVLQFSISIVLIIGTAIIYAQLKYARIKDLGLDKEQVVVVPIRDQRLRQNPEPVKHELLKNPYVSAVAAASLLPGGPIGQMTFRSPESPSGQSLLAMQALWVDYDFIKTLGLEMVAGRSFSRNFPTDATGAFILNETAVHEFGWKSSTAIGKPFERTYGPGAGERATGSVIGVVKDFHFKSLRTRIEPLAIHLWPWLNYVLVRIQPDHIPEVLTSLERTWLAHDPDHPFEYFFLDDNFGKMYRVEEQRGRVFAGLSSLAIVVACLGLLGLASFTAERRTKEIGIRKVLGASVARILGLLSKEFAVLVLLANAFAWPVGYLLVRRWLQEFAYRIDLTVWPFVGAGCLAILIALLTVGAQALRAALANPINALRYE